VGYTALFVITNHNGRKLANIVCGCFATLLAGIRLLRAELQALLERCIKNFCRWYAVLYAGAETAL